MRIKFPQILSFEDWFNLYQLPDDKNYIEKHDVFYDSKLGYLQEVKTRESNERKKIRAEILKTMIDNKEALESIEAVMVRYMRQYSLENPPVYLAYLTDSRNNDDEAKNLTAKTFWPMMGGKKKEIRIYIGKKKDYPAINDPKVIFEATKKMILHLKQRVDEGELSL